MQTPAVSVVIATYNYGRFLPAALDSLIRQTFPHFEAIIVDDGSTDDTQAVVERYRADPRLRYWPTAHVGQVHARNAGIRLARAPLIAFLDADDVWMPAKLERQVALFESDPAVGVVYSRRLLMDEEGFELEFRQPQLFRGDVLAALLANNFVCFSSSVFHRQVLQRIGLFDEALALAVDYDLLLRAAEHYPFDYVDEPLVRYRTGHTSLSRRVEERLHNVLHILRRFEARRVNSRPLPAGLYRASVAGTYSALALAARDLSRLRAFGWYCRALALRPGHVPTWKGLASLVLPETCRRWLRRALGQPADWRVRRRVPV